MQISITCHGDQKYVHGIQERYAIAKYYDGQMF